MSLPKIDVPIYTITLPSNGKKLKIRPFLVKEEKILLMAMEGGTNMEERDNDIIEAVKQIVSNCVQDPNFDVETAPVIDVEYIFLQLRAKSIGDIVTFSFTPDEKSECKVCQTKVDYKIALNEIKPTKNEKHSNKIEISPGLFVKMRYPSFDSILRMGTNKSKPTEAAFDMIYGCIEGFYDKETEYDLKDEPKEKVIEFLESLTQGQFGAIQSFFDTMPKLVTTVKYKCKGCGKDYEFRIEGIKDFFV